MTRKNKFEAIKSGHREAHFATSPEKLVEPCIKAGSPVGGG
jgi:hypothetical protein